MDTAATLAASAALLLRDPPLVGLIIGTTVFANTENGILLGVAMIYAIAQIFPSLSITVRRLRDSGKEWVWIFINLVPFIGGFWFLYLLVQPSVVG